MALKGSYVISRKLIFQVLSHPPVRWILVVGVLLGGSWSVFRPDHGGLEWGDWPEGLHAAQTPPHEGLAIAETIEFPSDRTTAQIKHSLLDQTYATYTLYGRAGQTLSLKLSSMKNNARFDLVGPPELLAAGKTEWRGRLPVTGLYRMTVRPTYDNTSYRIQVVLRD